MKTKKRFLLPAFAIALTACGPKTELPAGYNKIDPKNSVEFNNYLEKVNLDLKKNSAKAAEVSKTEITFNLDEFSEKAESKIDGEKESTEASISDVKFKVTSVSAGNTDDFSKYKEILAFEDFGFKLSAKEASGKKSSVKINDIDIYIYINDGKFYIDLSDDDIIDAIEDVFDFMEELSGREIDKESKKREFESIEKKCGKFVTTLNLSSLTVPLSTTFVEDFDQIVESFDEVITLLNQVVGKNSVDSYKEAIIFADYPNSDAVGFGFSTDPIFESLKEQYEKLDSALVDVDFTLDGGASGMVLFDEEGILSYAGIKGDFKYKLEEKATKYLALDITEVTTLDDLEFESTFEYGEQKFNFPDFSDFKENAGFDFDDLAEIIETILPL